MTTIYNYDPLTFEYISQNEARLAPLDMVSLIPANATDIPVINFGVNEVAIFDKNTQTWSLTPDFRGIVYDTITKQQIIQNDLGSLPSNLTTLVPGQFDSWDGTNWVEDLNLVKINQKNIIKQGFADELKLGYVCPTSGYKMDAYIENIDLLDSGVRLNEKLSATNMDIRDFNNIIHSNELVSNVNIMVQELGINYQTQLAKKWNLEAQIDASTTKIAIEAIIW